MTVTAAVACVLTSAALLPLFNSTLWFFIAVGAVIAVAAAGALTRLRTLPVAVCVAGSAAGLLLYLNLVFEARHSLLYVIPTPNSLARLFTLAGTGIHDSHRYAPPTPNLPGLLLLAAGGVGITAVLTDLIAVRLRSTALAGLPLLVLFTVPVMINAQHNQFAAGLVFCLGGAGYLAMLSADGRERIRVWGRLISLWRSGPRYSGPFSTDPYSGAPLRVRGRGAGPDTRALAAAGRRIGLASIVLALCAPLLLPGLHPSKLFSSGPGIGGNGGGASASLSLPSALAQTVQQLHESRPTTVFTYTTDATAAQQVNDAEYFRQYVFDTLGDAGWQVRDYTSNSVPVKAIGSPEGLTDTMSAQTVMTTVTVSGDFPTPSGQPTFLPLPYPAIQVSAPGKWLADSDRMVYSTTDSIAGRSYSVASVLVDPSQAELKAVLRLARTRALEPDLQLPASYQTAALKNLAESNTAGQSTEFGKVNALANWLSGAQFSYNLGTTPFTNAAGLLTFLTRTKSGFCVQYAYAMTVLTRLLGIPARFVVGYTAGTRLKTGSYEVKNIDAHAWTEVYFPAFGWIRFEPTPAGQGTAAPPSYMNSGTGLGGGAAPIVKNTLQPGQSGQQNKLSNQPNVPGASAGAAAGSAGRTGTPWTALALAVIAAIVLAFGLIAIVAPPTRRALSAHPAQAARRLPLGTAIAIFAAAAALVALALYRLMSRTSGLNITAGWATVGIAFGATAALALITPAAFRLALRRWRWMRAHDDTSRAHAAWREFHDDLADFGISSRPSEPPRTLAARITTRLPEPGAGAVTRLALAEERASYAARPTGSEQLRHDGTTARRALATTARRSTRWRAAIFPASMMTILARTADRAATLTSRRRGR
jgi:transglutaminase-like putative cysteine protease